MNNFERVKEWLARSLEISEESITPQSTLEELFRSSSRSYWTRVEWAFVLAFEKEFPGTDGEFLTQNTAVQQIAELIDSSETGEDGASARHLARQGSGDQAEPTQLPAIRVFDYVAELDAFLVNEEFRRLSAYMGLTEWHAAVWIGRLFMLDNDYGEHWFDNWDEREVLEERARELGIESHDLMVINPDRLANGGDGPCHSRKRRKLFWTDVLKSLELSYELLFEEARQHNADMKRLEESIRETNPSWKESIDDLEERIRQIREGREIPPIDHEP